MNRLGTCSKDPIGYEGSKWNLYEYCSSNPHGQTDSTGLCPDPRPDDVCCEDASKDPTWSGAGGAVLCCDGRKVICVFKKPELLDNLRPDYPWLFDPQGREISKRCLQAHEDKHYWDFNNYECPNKVPDLSDMKPPADEVFRSECRAYRIQIRCLRHRIDDCKTELCKISVEKSIELTIRARRKYKCDERYPGIYPISL